LSNKSNNSSPEKNSTTDNGINNNKSSFNMEFNKTENRNQSPTKNEFKLD